METFPCTTRILHFPSDKSLGWLFILRKHEADGRRTVGGSRWKREQRLAAQGTIELPRTLPLELWSTGGEKPDLTLLRTFQSDDLVRLTLAFCSVDDAALTHLSGLVGLASLDLTDTNITGTGLAYLHTLQQLEVLRLAYSNVQDMNLQYLHRMNSLQELDLNGTAVTDAGLLHLHQLTALQLLWLIGTSATPQGLLSLQRALPNCKIKGPD